MTTAASDPVSHESVTRDLLHACQVVESADPDPDALRRVIGFAAELRRHLKRDRRARSGQCPAVVLLDFLDRAARAKLAAMGEPGGDSDE